MVVDNIICLNHSYFGIKYYVIQKKKKIIIIIIKGIYAGNVWKMALFQPHRQQWEIFNPPPNVSNCSAWSRESENPIWMLPIGNYPSGFRMHTNVT